MMRSTLSRTSDRNPDGSPVVNQKTAFAGGGWIGIPKKAITSTGGTTRKAKSGLTGFTVPSKSRADRGTTISNFCSTGLGIDNVNDYVDAEHIQDFLSRGDMECLGSEVSASAFNHLSQSHPLHSKSTTTVIDWELIESTSIAWNCLSDDETAEWAKTTLAGICPFGLLAYNPTQPCLIGSLDFMVRNLDELVWKAPGCRLLFGVDRTDDGRVTFGRGVIEYDGKEHLYATKYKTDDVV